MASLRFGTDGVRGEAFTELTPTYVAALGRAAARVIGGRTWYLGRDTRESGAEFEAALAAGLIAGGAEVMSLGVLPTPAIAFLGQVDGVPTAAITASHNPYLDNGVKVFAAGGTKLTDEVEEELEAAIEPIAGVIDLFPFETLAASAAARYVDHLVGLTGGHRLDGMRIVIDCANGAMSDVAPRVLRALGADLTVIHADPDGRNINDECGATAPGSLAIAVVAGDAQLGLAFDGDGDRVIAVDHLGDVIDGDRLIALAALQLRDAGELVDDTVVVTVMSNLGFRRAMEAAGIHVVETAVGDRSVLAALDAGGFSVGGEQSGHIIYRHLATTGDGLLAGIRLAQHVHERERSLAELAGSVMHGYPQVLVNVRVRDRHPAVADELAAEIADAQADLGDDGRVLVRPSGTEPLIRVMVEAATAEQAQATADALAGIVRSRFA